MDSSDAFIFGEQQFCQPCGRHGFPLQRALCICQDCPTHERLMCRKCRDRHGEKQSPKHRMVQLETYLCDTTRYGLAKDSVCKKHPGKRYELICKYCGKYLCTRCLEDTDCSRGQAVPHSWEHHPESLYSRSLLPGPLADGHSMEVRGRRLMGQVDGQMKETTTLCAETVRQIVGVREQMDSLRTAVEDHMEAKMKEMSEIRMQLQMFMEEKANVPKVAEGMLACPNPLDVCDILPGLVSKLEKAPLARLPESSAFQLITSGVQQLEAQLNTISLNFRNSASARDDTPPPQPATQSRRRSNSVLAKTEYLPVAAAPQPAPAPPSHPSGFSSISTGFVTDTVPVATVKVPVAAASCPAPVPPSHPSGFSSISTSVVTDKAPVVNDKVPVATDKVHVATDKVPVVTDKVTVAEALQPAPVPPSHPPGFASVSLGVVTDKVFRPVIIQSAHIKPLECASVPSQSFSVEAADQGGLWLRNEASGWGRKQKGRKEKGWSYRGVCVSEDGKYCYCTRGNITGGPTYIEKYKVSDGHLELEMERGVEGSVCTYGISVCHRTGELAVLDGAKDRITLHSCADLRLGRKIGGMVSKVQLFQRSLGSVRVLGSLNYVAWHPSGNALFVSDDGFRSVPRSVMCLQLSRPPNVIWRTELEDQPWNVKYISSGYVCVTHIYANKVTVLCATDGRIVERIPCQGAPRGVKEGAEGEVLITSYNEL